MEGRRPQIRHREHLTQETFLGGAKFIVRELTLRMKSSEALKCGGKPAICHNVLASSLRGGICLANRGKWHAETPSAYSRDDQSGGKADQEYRPQL